MMGGIAMKKILKSCSALIAAASLIQSTAIVPAAAVQTGPGSSDRWTQSRIVTAQPNLNETVRRYAINPAEDPPLTNAQMTELVRDKIKYVFVIFNENESFDHEYGTFPGVNGLYSDGQNPRSAADTAGFYQTYTDVNGNSVTVQPFLIGPQQNATFADSTDHSHTGLAEKLDVNPATGVAAMDKFAQDEYARYAGTKANPGTTAKQKEGAEFAKLVMSHIDCNTIPFFWQYANRFTIFDNIFATEDTPSSPNAIAMIAGQSGETQWVKHPGETSPAAETLAYSGTINGATYNGTGTATPVGVPATGDAQPYWGSAFDSTTTDRQPTGAKESWAPTNTSVNLTFATVPLTVAGDKVKTLMAGDRNAAVDQADIATDIPYIETNTKGSFGWRWYQNGYDAEPNEPTPDGVNLTATTIGYGHLNYVSHHNGAQYFGYLSNNVQEQTNMEGENDFFTDTLNNKLPTNGGVIYIRGGYYNIEGRTPPIQNANYPDTSGLTDAELATINLSKSGDDDHPSYSDRQLSESMSARVINAIASNPKLWAESAIVITYDESDGLYDHVPPQILSYGPDSLPLARGVRIPLLLISPYARAGAVSHAEGDHNAIIETINAIFGLQALSSLPEEKAALAAGNSATFNQYGPAGFEQKYLGPRDTNSPITDSLLSGFSPRRLAGFAEPLPASYVTIPSETLYDLPHYGGKGCSAIGVTPVSPSVSDTPPANFNTLPSTLPAYNNF
jgi:phospholipase C